MWSVSLFDIDETIKPYKEEANNSLPTQITGLLGEMSAEELEKSLEILAPVFDEDELNKLKDALKDALDNLDKKQEQYANSALKEQNKFKQANQAQQVSQGSVTQDAEVSQTFPEPSVETDVSSPTDLADADNSLAEDYPNSLGYTDECGNFYKVNRSTGFVQFVHKSGTCVKIDGQGNVTIHATGSAKIKADKDLAIQAKNLDIKADKLALTAQEIKLKADSKVEVDTMTIDASKPLTVKLDSALVTGQTFKGGALVSAPMLSIG